MILLYFFVMQLCGVSSCSWGWTYFCLILFTALTFVSRTVLAHIRCSVSICWMNGYSVMLLCLMKLKCKLPYHKMLLWNEINWIWINVEILLWIGGQFMCFIEPSPCVIAFLFYKWYALPYTLLTTSLHFDWI
jgi:hypothetical protein